MEMTEPLVLIFTLSGQGGGVSTGATVVSPRWGHPRDHCTLEVLAGPHPPGDIDGPGTIVDAALEGGILARGHSHAVRVDGDDGALQACGDKGTGEPLRSPTSLPTPVPSLAPRPHSR